MTQTSYVPGPDGPVSDRLIKFGKFFSKWEESEDNRTVYRQGGRKGDVFYRDRWSYDKVVRSTHGVNCTGSCSWQVYVKDGVITWEAQATDYPTIGPDRPEYEPRGCPRGAAFSWYTYSPTRVKYPYIRGPLLEMYREEKARIGDPVEAWTAIVSDPAKRNRYVTARGKGGLVRATWTEALEIVAAAQIHTIRTYGPDRNIGFSPIPAKSMGSHASGARYIELMGGVMTSFYDWYADLPVASPQVFGDQTDVRESGDWWDATYLMMWGSNIPVTRTPDAHWMAEVRYRGTKVVTVSPDYADNTKFADEWLPAQPGTDAALAMAMGHVILKENFVDQRVEFFEDYVTTYTDFPFLVRLETREDGTKVPHKFVKASDLSIGEGQADADFKTALINRDNGEVFIPNGTLGHRYNEEDMGKWNLDLNGVKPALSINDVAGGATGVAEIKLPAFDTPDGAGHVVSRGVPTLMVEGMEVTTVFDLMLAQYGIGRPGLPGNWAKGLDDVTTEYTPAWQEEITSVPAEAVIRVAREFAQNSIDSKGRTMIILGAGICQWYHGDATYRAILALLMMCGCEGRNGGGWAHYVGQEKARPITGWAHMANALDWVRPPRTQAGTSFWYMHTDQWRLDGYSADSLQSPLAKGELKGVHTADILARSARMGWMPFYPQFPENSLDLADKAAVAVESGAAENPAAYVAGRLNSGDLEFSVEDVDNPVNWPRTLMLWRNNLLGSSAKGEEYFLKHLLGTHNNVMGAGDSDVHPREIKWHENAPEGKLDLLVTADFRMTSSTLSSDIVFPTATWYEKFDISSTDMHPYIHAFTPAIDPPWEAKTDYQTFKELAYVFSKLAAKHLGTRKDVVSVPLQHDTPGQIAQPGGHAPDWKNQGVKGIPGKNMPIFTVVERDYPALYDMYTSVGPLLSKLGTTTKAITVDVNPQLAKLAEEHGVMNSGKGEGLPALDTIEKLVDTILALSGTSNGPVAIAGFKQLEKRVGKKFVHLAEGNEEKRITFRDTQDRPCPVFTSPEWSGSETGGRRYAPFTLNIEQLKPFHTLTGRMHFFLDHDWMNEMGEQMPTYRPPLDMHKLFNQPILGTQQDEVTIAVRYMTPHNKWAIHSSYHDNLYMLALSRGGSHAWISPQDAERIGVKDNDWIECINDGGVFVGRAVVSHRLPQGVVYVHHAQERLVDTPKSEATGKRGGIHNSVTRILVKPTHLIGGYAHQAYAFNYLGPTGNQRDIVSVIRRRKQEVTY
ncbi:nitrate reductase subunit alpha [Rothia sp. ZJ932]|uniref:nitrate reductase subunit alpha n=1 Tax=Rothia sp. ZJ932 TaxID=2810516 RepID=UPI00196734B4|nr:nitrate reductase subunit alpha [Rothia sp. ZJ932]QRZ62061.1 nitrate reductase subunit alpha [Rothia sp. ZJ932]